MAATNYYDNIISADSHFIEPHELWWHAIGDRTPRLIQEYHGRKGSFFYSGNRGAAAAAITELNPASHAAAAAEDRDLGASGYLPEIRVKFQ